MEQIRSGKIVKLGTHGAKVGRFKCPVCSVDFVRYLSEVRIDPPTCSRACKVKFKPTKPRQRGTLSCEKCGSHFEVKRHRTSGPRRAHFCSDTCKNSAHSAAGHSNWKGGISPRSHSSRAMVRARVEEEGRCQKCGAPDHLHGHHIKHYATHPDLRDDPQNILVLCGPCHALEHPNFAGALVRPAVRSGSVIDCPECGVGFYVKPSHIPFRTYCSRRCAATNRPRRSA